VGVRKGLPGQIVNLLAEYEMVSRHLKIPRCGNAWRCPVITLVFTIKLSSE
jgi:hypothetical protein